MSCDLGRDVPGSERLYAGKLWADFFCSLDEMLVDGGACTLRVW